MEEHQLTASPASSIKYKTEKDTLFDNQNAQDGIRTYDQVSHIAAQVPLMEVLLKLKAHHYVLHGGGKTIQNKKYAESAGQIVEKIETLLSKKLTSMIPNK
ncbi:hypothetical protein Lbir_1172 [Legionella birminghamensis]|uniref:Uncharacterized protein n=1 Tax=Legionella birminghamensis TaxID=28083 RepID=A0A378I5T3_9GAMM|nr:hypothetical protein [Legionella birminghamensis]KTC72397.1 hypothetical protein Lbir_1172 [Legionella birminghamensis]STX30529.1 Uncharacterised protein [Legionella birminghamensis]